MVERNSERPSMPGTPRTPGSEDIIKKHMAFLGIGKGRDKKNSGSPDAKPPERRPQPPR